MLISKYSLLVLSSVPQQLIFILITSSSGLLFKSVDLKSLKKFYFKLYLVEKFLLIFNLSVTYVKNFKLNWGWLRFKLLKLHYIIYKSYLRQLREEKIHPQLWKKLVNYKQRLHLKYQRLVWCYKKIQSFGRTKSKLTEARFIDDSSELFLLLGHKKRGGRFFRRRLKFWQILKRRKKFFKKLKRRYNAKKKQSKKRKLLIFKKILVPSELKVLWDRYNFNRKLIRMLLRFYEFIHWPIVSKLNLPVLLTKWEYNKTTKIWEGRRIDKLTNEVILLNVPVAHLQPFLFPIPPSPNLLHCRAVITENRLTISDLEYLLKHSFFNNYVNCPQNYQYTLVHTITPLFVSQYQKWGGNINELHQIILKYKYNPPTSTDTGYVKVPLKVPLSRKKRRLKKFTKRKIRKRQKYKFYYRAYLYFNGRLNSRRRRRIPVIQVIINRIFFWLYGRYRKASVFFGYLPRRSMYIGFTKNIAIIYKSRFKVVI